jgi:hypothetical protein
MHRGYLKFHTDVEREKKQELFDEVENLEKVYATNGDSFEEFLVTVVSEGDTIYIPSLSDCYSEFQQLLRILDFLKANESVKLVVLEGVVNEFWLGVTTGQAAKAAKDFHKMLTTGQIS